MNSILKIISTWLLVTMMILFALDMADINSVIMAMACVVMSNNLED